MHVQYLRIYYYSYKKSKKTKKKKMYILYIEKQCEWSKNLQNGHRNLQSIKYYKYCIYKRVWLTKPDGGKVQPLHDQQFWDRLREFPPCYQSARIQIISITLNLNRWYLGTVTFFRETKSWQQSRFPQCS